MSYVSKRRDTSFKRRIHDINNTNASKDCDICHYWYFKDIGFKHEPYLFNGCHDLIQKVRIFNDAAIAYVKGSAYRTNLWYTSKNDTVGIINNSDLVDKKGVL